MRSRNRRQDVVFPCPELVKFWAWCPTLSHPPAHPPPTPTSPELPHPTFFLSNKELEFLENQNADKARRTTSPCPWPAQDTSHRRLGTAWAGQDSKFPTSDGAAWGGTAWPGCCVMVGKVCSLVTGETEEMGTPGGQPTGSQVSFGDPSLWRC